MSSLLLCRFDVYKDYKINGVRACVRARRVVWRCDALASKVTESAMGVTRGVVDAQNGQRKAFMEHLRRAHATAACAARTWQRLVDSYTHERGSAPPCTYLSHDLLTPLDN